MTRMIEGMVLDDALARYEPRVRRFLSSIGADDAEVDDLTQETLLRIAGGWGACRGEAKLSSWVFRIAANARIDAYRRRASLPPAEGSAPDQTPTGVHEDPERAASVRQMSACVMEKMEALPDAYARIIVAFEFDGLPLAEIARREKCTPNAVKTRLSRARKRFRDILEASCDFSRNREDVLVCEPKRGC